MLIARTSAHFLLLLLLLFTRYCMTLCCVRGVWLPQLPGGYLLWLLCVTSATRYCMTLCCVHGVRLPQLPGGYLWLPLVTSVTSMVTSVTWWLFVITMCYQCYQVLHDSMLCTWCIVTFVTCYLVGTHGYLLPALPGTLQGVWVIHRPDQTRPDQINWR